MTQRQGVSRRGFLRSAGVSAAGVMAAPYFVPASVLGATQKKSPSERITLGFIGMGKIGKELWNELRGTPVYFVNPEEKTTYASVSKCKTFTSASKNKDYIYAKLVRHPRLLLWSRY